MKNRLKLIFIIAFLAVIIMPLVTMAFGYEVVSTENRILASMPSIIEEGGFNTQFPSQFDDYFSDNFGMRSHLISANAWLYKNLLSDSPNEKIIIGSDDYLYYNDTLDDYMALNTLDDGDIAEITGLLSGVNEYVEGYGGKFVLLVAPNKNRVYPQYMPSYIVEGEDSNYDKLMTAVKSAGIDVIDAMDVLSGKDEILYHKYDTHWNNLGAYMVYEDIMEYIDVDYSHMQDIEFTKEYNWTGDLYRINMPIGSTYDLQYTYDMEINYKSKKAVLSPRQMNIDTTSDINDVSAIVFRDSFGDALYPYFASSFGQLSMTTAVPYDMDSITAEHPDVVIIEITERNIELLLGHLSGNLP